jgi:hypothetical protein
LCLCAEGGPLDLTAKLEQDRTFLAKDPHRRSKMVSDEGDGVPPFNAKVAEVNQHTTGSFRATLATIGFAIVCVSSPGQSFLIFCNRDMPVSESIFENERVAVFQLR